MSTQFSRHAAEPVLTVGATDLGHIAIAAYRGEILAVSFGHRTSGSALQRVAKLAALNVGDSGPISQEDDQNLADDVLDRLQRFGAGESVDFSDVLTSAGHLSTFQRRVVKACRAIPRGERRSYGELAVAAGSPGAARAVGQVMAANRHPLIVPCHRVVAAGGRIGGFSAPEGITMKCRLLNMESC